MYLILIYSRLIMLHDNFQGCVFFFIIYRYLPKNIRDADEVISVTPTRISLGFFGAHF